MKFTDVFTKADWIKVTILVVISVICWTWVWREYQKPIIPPEWEQEFLVEN
jgi:hypothetical protein